MVPHLVCSGEFHSFNSCPRDWKSGLEHSFIRRIVFVLAASFDSYPQTRRWVQSFLKPSKPDNNITSMFRRLQVIKRRRCVFERENLLVHNRLQIHFVLREEVAQVLLILGGSHTDTPSTQVSKRNKHAAEKYCNFKTYCIFADFFITGMTQSGISF